MNIKKRLFNLCYHNKLHHLGSYFSSIDIMDNIFEQKKKDDIFILSAGHAAMSLYVVLEKYYGFDAQKLLDDLGEHPKLDEERNIYCSTGSLGMGLSVAVGRALANPHRKVYCLITDGECAEGVVWESLSFIKTHGLKNIEVHVNMNGFCAYDSIDTEYLTERLKIFLPEINIHNTTVNHLPCLSGIDAHYYSLGEDDKQYGDIFDEKRI